MRTVAKAFIKLGLERYHSVCILGFNSEQWFVADLAAIHAGLVCYVFMWHIRIIYSFKQKLILSLILEESNLKGDLELTNDAHRFKVPI